jgi:hypothetical protein
MADMNGARRSPAAARTPAYSTGLVNRSGDAGLGYADQERQNDSQFDALASKVSLLKNVNRIFCSLSNTCT